MGQFWLPIGFGAPRASSSMCPSPAAAIFAADDTAQLSLGYVMPKVTGKDRDGGAGDYDVGVDYPIYTLSYTNRVSPQFNYAVIMDNPFGVSLNYGEDPTTSNLGGTKADLDSTAVSFVGRFQLNQNLSVFGGVKAERVGADVTLNGLSYGTGLGVSAVATGFNRSLPAVAPRLSAEQFGAALQAAQGGNLVPAGEIDATYGPGTFGALSSQVAPTVGAIVANGGYNFRMDDDTQPGYLIGAAYEIPDIALRFAATYHFEIEHKADTVETIAGVGAKVNGSVEYKTPASLNLEFQTGIAPGTLLTAGYRWTEFSEVDVVPDVLGRDLVNLEDGHRYTIGLGRQFSETLAGSVSFIYEPEGDDLVSPLGPTNGLFGVSIGGAYTDGDLRVSGGLNYSKLGDAKAEVGGNPVADFEDNYSIALGFRAEMKF